MRPALRPTSIFAEHKDNIFKPAEDRILPHLMRRLDFGRKLEKLSCGKPDFFLREFLR